MIADFTTLTATFALPDIPEVTVTVVVDVFTKFIAVAVTVPTLLAETGKFDSPVAPCTP
jgi:hypothetical protein